ncbi:MAG: J domain-containing protein [Syntrophales bacterium]
MQDTTASTSSDLYKACTVLFGTDANISGDFLKCLKASRLKRAYRKRALETHPDRATALAESPLSLTERFREVNFAYNQLNTFLEYPWRYSHSGYAGRRSHEHESVRRKQKAFESHDHRRMGSGAHRSRYQGMSEHLWQGGLPRKQLLLGRFLYYSGIISMKSLIEAIVWQKGKRPMVGNIALRWDWLDQDDVLSIISMRRRGEKFCECALRCGYISSYQRTILLARQRMLQPLIGSFFTDRKIIAPQEMERIAEQFHTHNREHWRK